MVLASVQKQTKTKQPEICSNMIRWSGERCERSAAFPDDDDEDDVQCLGSCGLADRCPESALLSSGLRCFPLGAFRFVLRLPGAFRRAADGGRSSGGGGWARIGAGALSRRRVVVSLKVAASLQLFVLHAAQLSRGRPGTQRPLLVGLAEGVGAELAEGVRVLPADVTVMPGTVPASCREQPTTTATR